MEAANDVVYLALEGGELLHSARGPPTPTRQALGSATQGLTVSGGESALPLPCGSWQCTAQDPSVEPVPGGARLLRITALLQRADGSWRTAVTEYDDGDELNNKDGEFVHSIYHIGGDACCGLGTKGRERRGMPTWDRAACADCALRIMRRSPDRPCCDAGCQCDPPLPCPPPEPAAAQPRGSGAEPAPTRERASWRAGAAAQVLVEVESGSRALLEEFALDWGQLRIMWEDDIFAIGCLADMKRVATRAIELGEKHQALVEQHQQLAADHRELKRSYQRMAQRSAAVAAVAQHCRVARVLGRGSYGTVLQTVPDHGGAPEVIKVPHDDGAAAHEARGARLVRRAFGRAPPPGLEGLVPRAELRLEGRQCTVFPLCGGGNLHTLVQCGRLAPKRVEQHARRLLGGLQALHAAKLVHGDIKLENILITSSGQPTLADVGLLRTEAECARRSEGGWGTPAYISPEAEAGPSGCPADMWALGCALWEMLMGDLTREKSLRSALLDAAERASAAAHRERGARTLAAECMFREAQRRVQSLEAAESLAASEQAADPGCDQHRRLIIGDGFVSSSTAGAACAPAFVPVGTAPASSSAVALVGPPGGHGLPGIGADALDDTEDQSVPSPGAAAKATASDMTTAERDAVRKIEGRLVTSEVVAFSVAAHVPGRWAPVCRAAALSCAWAMSCWSTGFLAHIQCARPFRSMGPDSPVDAYRDPQRGELWIAHRELGTLLARVENTPCATPHDRAARGFLMRRAGLHRNLCETLRLEISELLTHAWLSWKRAGRTVEVFNAVLGCSDDEPASP